MADFYSDLYDDENNEIRIPIPRYDGQTMFRACNVAFTSSVAQNDVLHLFTLPGGCVPVYWTLWIDDLDSNASPTGTIDFGWVGSTDALLNGADVGTSGGDTFSYGTNDGAAGPGSTIPESAASAAYPPAALTGPSADAELQILVATALVTPAAGTAYVRMLYAQASRV